MKEIERNKQIEKMKGQSYRSMRDLFAEFNELDVDVHEITSDYIIAGYYDREAKEAVLVKVALGGTERTTTIEAIEEIQRY